MKSALFFLLLLMAALPAWPSLAWESRKAVSELREEGENPAAKTHALKILTKEGGQHVFNVELALEPGDQIRGLMFRTELPEDGGMLFLFPDSQERYFWMKNTYIPLDIIFIRGDGIIHHIHKNAVPGDQRHIPSRGAVPAVLEINAGLAEKLGIKPGDRIADGTFFAQ